MSLSRLESLKIKAKLLQKAKLKAGKPVKLSEAFAILARHAGFKSWRAFKDSVSDAELFCPPNGRAYWNTWYSSYDEARAHIQSSSGFLLPYQQQYFICDIDYIERLGLAQDDPDLKKVGPNWVEPLDREAYERILKKIRAVAARTE